MSSMSDIELFRRLIAFNTVSSNSNAEAADFLADYLEQAGCELHRHTYSDGDKVNLLAVRQPQAVAGGGPAPDGLLLSGHLDVVPAHEPGWNSDPFMLRESDHRLIGRGTADMKGFVALAANRLADVNPRSLRAPAALLLTADEELGSLGAQAFVHDWTAPVPLPRNAIIGEPTGMRVVRMHKGHLKARITVHGKPAHSGYPQLGVNAIERATSILIALRELAATWRDQRLETSEHFPDCPHPVLNIGRISGGGALNVVPERCRIELGMRLLPGQQSDQALAELRDTVCAASQDWFSDVELTVINDSPPMLCDKHAPANIELARELGQCATVGVSFASDAGTLQKLGVNCVLWGPGRIEDAHRANEFVDRRQWERAGPVLERFWRRFCEGR